MRRYARGPARSRTSRALIAATLLARFPIGINALAIDPLPARTQTGSFAVAGVVAGGARRRRRASARRCRGGSSTGSASGACSSRSRSSTPPRSAAIVACAELGAPTVRAGRLLGSSAGFAIPPTSSVLRSLWPTLLRDRDELLQAAYALDSVLIELIFIARPAADRG